MKLLDRRYLPKSMIVVFCRPSAIEQLQNYLVTKRIELFGFSKKHISEYIDNYPFTESSERDSAGVTRASQLKEYLHLNPSIHDMCYLPIHAAMICFLSQFAKITSSSQTKVYEEFIRLTIQRHLTRHEECKELASLKDLKGVHVKHFENLCCLAYEMTINSKQVISSQEVQAQLGGSGHLSEEEGLGLLTICPTLYQTGIYQNYAFLHLTVQEFLTAYYIANYLDEKHQVNLVLKYAHLKRLWRFYISLIDFTEALKRIDIFISREDKYALHLCQCAYDLQQKMFCDEVIKRKSRRLKCDNIQTPADILAIDYVIETSSLSLTELMILNYDQDDERIISLFSHLQKKDLQELDALIFSTLFDNGTASLCEVVKLATNITELHLKIKHTVPCNSTKLANQINHCKKLKNLELCYSGTQECIRSFVSSLRVSVPECSLLLNKLDSQNIQALGTGLAQIYCDFLMLVVTESDINDIAMNCFADGLWNINSLWLDLSCNMIDSNGIMPLAERLDTISLIVLDISHNCIDSDGATALAREMKWMIELLELDLSYNNIGSDGAIAIAREIKFLTYLERLNLSYNNIGPESAIALAEEAKCLKNLKTFVISDNNIDVAAAKVVISTLKECSVLIISTSDDEAIWNIHIREEIVIEGLVSPDDTTTISDLVEAAQHETKSKKLNLGFKTIQVSPKN